MNIIITIQIERNENKTYGKIVFVLIDLPFLFNCNVIFLGLFRINKIIYTGIEKLPPNNNIFPQFDSRIWEKLPSMFIINNRKPEINAMVEIIIINLCTLGKSIDNDPSLLIGLNIKITKNVRLHHKTADKKWKCTNSTINILSPDIDNNFFLDIIS